MTDRYEGEVVRIALVAGDEGVIRDANFERCDIKGPAVLVFSGETVVQYNRFDGDPDAIFWEVSPNRPQVIGAVSIHNCSFTGCHFMNVGIAGPREFLDRFRD